MSSTHIVWSNVLATSSFLKSAETKRISLSLKYCATHSSGGSRAFPRNGHQTLEGRLPNISIIFSEKPFEIKEILARRGGAGCDPSYVRHCIRSRVPFPPMIVHNHVCGLKKHRCNDCLQVYRDSLERFLSTS